MRKVDESRAANYIRKHTNYKKWLAFVLCLSLLTGTITLYIMNKPATAMTEDGAEEVGVVLDTASAEDEAEWIQQTMENKLESNGDGNNDDGSIFDFGDGDDDDDDEDGEGVDADELKKSGENTETEDLVEEEVKEGEEEEKEEKEEAKEEDELSEDVVITVSYVDENGEAIADEKEIDIYDSLDFSEEAPSIDGYTFEEATYKEDAISKITVKKNADDIRYYEVTFADGDSKEIKKDATIVLTYIKDKEEVEVESKLVLTAKYVDKDGEEIQDSEEVSFAEETSLNNDNVPEIDGYFFMKATYEGEEIVKIAPVEAEEEDTEEEAEASEEDEEEAESVSVEAYEFTTADGETIEITEDAEIEYSYMKACEETEFTFSDGKVTVTATINGKNVFPDGIELKAVEVTKDSSSYNYDAYMDALNDNADDIAEDAGKEDANEFTEDNTLLYDIAFVYEGKEIQPKEGTVTVKIEFMNNQLTEDLSASSEEDLTVVHLPITESFKEENEIENTEDATGISSGDIDVVTLTGATVDVEGTEKVEFETDSFSVYAITSLTPNLSAKLVDVSYDFMESFGDAYDYGVIANDYKWQGDTETNVMVGVFSGDTKEIGASSNYSNAGGNNYFGEIKKWPNDGYLWFYQPPANIYLGKKATEKYDPSRTNPIASGKYQLRNVDGTNIVTNHDIDVKSIIKSIGEYYDKYETVSDYVYDPTPYEDGAGKVTVNIDLHDLPGGTYVLNYNGDNIDLGGGELLNITIKSDQHLILNCTSPNLKIRKYKINGIETDTLAGSSAKELDWLTTAVVFNIVKAEKITIDQSWCGVFIAPNSEVNQTSACGGILVADKVNGSAEWHFHNHDLPSVYGTQIELKANKTVDDKEPAENEIFSFELTEWDNSNNKWKETSIETKQNVKGEIKFKPISYGVSTDKGVHYYRIVEIPGTSTDYEYDSNVYVAKVEVTTERIEGKNEVRYKATAPKYYVLKSKDANPTKAGSLSNESTTAPTFKNTTNGDLEFHLLKYVNGVKPVEGEQYNFTVRAFTKTNGTGPRPTTKISDPLRNVTNSLENITVSFTLKELTEQGAIVEFDTPGQGGPGQGGHGNKTKKAFFIVTEDDMPEGSNVIKDQSAIIVIVTNPGANQTVEYVRSDLATIIGQRNLEEYFKKLSGSPEVLAFNNTRPTEIKVKKNYIGGTWTKDVGFTFKIEKLGDNANQPMPEKVEQTVYGGENTRDVVFGPLEFDQSINGEYIYVISETKGDRSEVQYDSHKIYVKVVVQNNKLLEPQYYSDKECKTPVEKAEFNNYEKSYLIVKKKWTKNGEEITNPEFTTPIYVKVYRSYSLKYGTHGEDFEEIDGGKYELMKWSRVASGVYEASDSGESMLAISNGTEWQLQLLTEKIHPADTKRNYCYYVREYVLDTMTNEYVEKKNLVIYTTSYKNKSSVNWNEVYAFGNANEDPNFTLTVTNEVGDNVLPSTGGIGDIPYMAAGAGTAVVGLLGTGLYYKKKKDEDQEEE
ncbi:LPXTG cell wall anchor domain-containing protein [Butyrivibrio sp. CB08]|uniref:Spy0128 family protein n=1 Tax=Butyrivibrio sp. CB08 TaxID=2364879 RepID=UPI000EA969BE|nr:MucBP domain-containing protein [Butyrivibrio sp. CB08]RKM61184.1 LPXTG cell wall anchor domain-containing protein [Butyrivibrio sp. CB08]